MDLKNFRSQKRVFEDADLILIFVFLPFGPSLFSLSFKIYFFSLINMLRLSVSISFFFLAYFTTTLVESLLSLSFSLSLSLSLSLLSL